MFLFDPGGHGGKGERLHITVLPCFCTTLLSMVNLVELKKIKKMKAMKKMRVLLLSHILGAAVSQFLVAAVYQEQ